MMPRGLRALLLWAAYISIATADEAAVYEEVGEDVVCEEAVLEEPPTLDERGAPPREEVVYEEAVYEQQQEVVQEAVEQQEVVVPEPPQEVAPEPTEEPPTPDDAPPREVVYEDAVYEQQQKVVPEPQAPPPQEPPPPRSCARLDLGIPAVEQHLKPEPGKLMFERLGAEIERRMQSLVSSTFIYDDTAAVGVHEVQWDLVLQEAGVEFEECVVVTYEISDTNECLLTAGPWAHKCSSTAECVNTVGGYYCACAEKGFGRKGGKPHWAIEELFTHQQQQHQPVRSRDSPAGLCWGHADTRECCASVDDPCHAKECIEACLSDFVCVADPCAVSDCPRHSSCKPLAAGGSPEMWVAEEESRSSLRGGYTCECDHGYQRDDNDVCVAIPTLPKPDPCLDNACPCNCDCRGSDKGYTCEPARGFRKIAFGDLGDDNGRRLDPGTMCVPEARPSLVGLGKQPLRLTQGQDYVELGALVVNSLPSKTVQIMTRYDQPGKLGKCLTEIGDFTVTYTLKNEGLVAKRTVHVGDVDECTYKGEHQQFRHACKGIARCVNSIGSYECHCPPGFQLNTTTMDCVDVSAPLITCSGAGCKPKLYRATDIQGLISLDGDYEVYGEADDLAFAKLKIEQLFKHGKSQNIDVFCETRRAGKPCFLAQEIGYLKPQFINRTNSSATTNKAVHVDLTGSIELADLTLINATSGRLLFELEYSVTNAVGLVSRDYRRLVVTNVTDTMQSEFARPFNRRNLRIVLCILLLTLAYLFRAELQGAALVAPFAAAYALSPKRAFEFCGGDRHLFVQAVDLYLFVTRLGFLDDRGRTRRAYLEWTDIQNVLDDDDDDDDDDQDDDI